MLNNSPGVFIKTLRFLYRCVVNLFTVLVLTVAVVLAVGFASLNAKLVTVNYYIGSAEMSLALLLMVCLGAGILLGILALAPSLIRQKCFNKRLDKTIKRTEEAMERLRVSQSSEK